MNDLISRQDAIDALKICDNNEDGINCHKCPLRDKRWDGAWQDDETNCYTKMMRDSAKLLEMSSVQPRKGKWILDNPRSDDSLIYIHACSECHAHHRERYDFCPSCGADMREGDSDEIN